MTRNEEIAAREKAATPLTIEKLAARHSVCGMTNCTVCYLLAQLAEAREKLEAVEK